MKAVRDRRLKVSDEMILRNIAGEYILIPVGAAALKIHGMISLSESGLLLWNKLQEECSETELVDAILSEYEIDNDTAVQDVRAFVNKLESIGILTKV